MKLGFPYVNSVDLTRCQILIEISPLQVPRMVVETFPGDL